MLCALGVCTSNVMELASFGYMVLVLWVVLWHAAGFFVVGNMEGINWEEMCLVNHLAKYTPSAERLQRKGWRSQVQSVMQSVNVSTSGKSHYQEEVHVCRRFRTPAIRSWNLVTPLDFLHPTRRSVLSLLRKDPTLSFSSIGLGECGVGKLVSAVEAAAWSSQKKRCISQYFEGFLNLPPDAGDRMQHWVMYMCCCGRKTFDLGAEHIGLLIFSLPSTTARFADAHNCSRLRRFVWSGVVYKFCVLSCPMPLYNCTNCNINHASSSLFSFSFQMFVDDGLLIRLKFCSYESSRALSISPK